MPSFRKYQVHTLSADFRAATKIVEVPEIPKAAAGQVIVKNHYVGIMATDTVLPNGFYGHTTPPFDCGIEAVGVVTEVGAGVENFKVGSAIVYTKLPGAFAEYVEVDAATAIPIPSPDPTALPLFNCGVSASIALEQAGNMKQGGQTVLVTAAAGTTGQYVVQLAKIAGNTVIATTSSDEKAAVLKKLGADRVINYSKENISAVLKAEYPSGMDLVFDSVGGDMLDAAVDNIAVGGRVIIYGLLSTYKDAPTNTTLATEIAVKLLMKSASLQGFAVMFHLQHAPAHIGRLMALTQEGKLVSEIDPTPFSGLEAIPEAIDYMYAKKNVGKLVVKLV